MKRLGLLAIAVVVAFLAGCGGSGGGGDNGSSDESAIRTNLLRVADGWANQDTAPFYDYYSIGYNFDGVGQNDHLQSIFEQDWPYMSNWQLTNYSIAVQDSTYARADIYFSMLLYADVAAVGEPVDEQWASSSGRLAQIWQHDSDGVWRIAAEYLAAASVLANRPTISGISVASGETFVKGDSYPISATASAPDASYYVAFAPHSWAAELDAGGLPIFYPSSVYDQQTVDYDGDFPVSDTSYGEYALTFVGQADQPPQTTMIGRRIDALPIWIADRAAERPAREYLPPTGIRRGVLRALRSHGAAAR